jgi:hypothetical protein
MNPTAALCGSHSELQIRPYCVAQVQLVGQNRSSLEAMATSQLRTTALAYRLEQHMDVGETADENQPSSSLGEPPASCVDVKVLTHR